MPSRLVVALVIIGLSIGIGPLPPVPKTGAIVAAVRRYVSDYQRTFISLVADEHTTQRVTTAGTVTATRETSGELFSVYLEDERAWMSVHDIMQVDGAPAPPHADVRALLRSQSMRAIAPWLAAANARYNIGHVTRNFNEPTLALLLFAPEHADDVRVSATRARPESGEPLVALRVRGRRGFALVHSLTSAVSMDATVDVEPDSGRVHHTTLTFSDHQVDATLETRYAFDDHVAMLVPVRFIERYTEPRSQEVTTVESALTNYRRFEVTARMVP